MITGFRKSIKISAALLLVVSFAAMEAPELGRKTYVNAETIGDLQMENIEAEKKKKEAQGIVDTLTSDRDNIVEAIEAIDLKVAEYNEKINELVAQKKELEAQIEGAKQELEVAQDAENKQYETMKMRIQYAYENDDTEYLDTVFASADMAEIINDAEYAEQIYMYDEDMLSNLALARKDVVEKKSVLQDSLNEIEIIEKEVNDDLAAVQIMLDGKNKQLANYEESIDEYETIVAQIEKEIAKREAEIAAIQEEMRKREAAALAAGRPITSFYTGGTLNFPLPMVTYVTSDFGPRNLFGRSFHYGVDLKCPEGTPVFAAEAGEVVKSYRSATAGEYIVIYHGNGLYTGYMHNSSRVVQEGDIVARGQIISYSGNTGLSTGPHLDFSVIDNGQKVDPLNYLPLDMISNR